MLWKGRLLFKQYIPSKRSRSGVKLFSLCEDSGYLWSSFVYLKNINYLYENQTCATGTARKHQMRFSFRRNENMLALRFQDKKEMYMLSTMHKADTVNVRRRNRREDNIIQKPKAINDYNQKMG